MRITNAVTRNNVLWSMNRNEVRLNKYETQMSTGKKIQRPSEDPIVAVRALRFRANVSEIEQYKTNSEDAKSWLNVTEQAVGNSIELLQRARELSVQGASDIFKTSDRESIIAELEEIKTQFSNEGNVSYAGRYIFSGFKTNTPLVFTEADASKTYEITEHFEDSDIETIQKVIGNDIQDVHRVRLGYGDISMTLPADINGITIVEKDSRVDGDAYVPTEDTIHYLKDTGELIFHQNNVDGVAPAISLPANFDVTYTKSSFERYDLVPETSFDCTITSPLPAVTYTAPDDQMKYQISYNQDLAVNTMGNQVFTNDLMRDFEEIITAVRNIPDDNSLEQSLEEDVLGDFFQKMLTKLDGHINTMVRTNSEIGSKINRIDLTINRLEDDKINFTDLLSENEDVDYTEAVLNFQAQEMVYNAALMSSGKLLQNTLLDFIR